MKILIRFIGFGCFAFAIILSVEAFAQTAKEMRVMTYNICYKNKDQKYLGKMPGNRQQIIGSPYSNIPVICVWMASR